MSKTMVRLPPKAAQAVSDARACRKKGDYTQYQHFVNRLRFLDLTPKEYQETVKLIAEAIGV